MYRKYQLTALPCGELRRSYQKVLACGAVSFAEKKKWFEIFSFEGEHFSA